MDNLVREIQEMRGIQREAQLRLQSMRTREESMAKKLESSADFLQLALKKIESLENRESMRSYNADRNAKQLEGKMIHMEGCMGWMSFWMGHLGMPHYQPPVLTAPGSSTDVGELQ